MTDDPFVTHRSLLFTVTYEMLGSAADAEDVVQETWLRWADVDRAEVRDPRAYLVRIVTRQALNRLRTLARRREEYVGEWLPEPLLTSPDVAKDVELAESVSFAMLTVLAPDVVVVSDGGGVVAAARRPIEGADRVGALLGSLVKRPSDFEVMPMWLNGGPAARFDLDGELNTVASLVIEDGRITRIYAIRNPHKLARLDEEAKLSR